MTLHSRYTDEHDVDQTTVVCQCKLGIDKDSCSRVWLVKRCFIRKYFDVYSV